MRPTICVCGAGIAGMSAAHELAKKGFEVHIYEYANSCGGQARSSRDHIGFPTEYSWRGYGQFYKNVYEVMKDIPSPMCGSNILKSNLLSVYDTELSKPVQFILTRDESRGKIGSDVLCDAKNWSASISTTEWITLQAQFFREITSDDRISEYAKINAKEWLKDKLYASNLINVVSVFGPWIGITSDRLSLHHMMNFFRMIEYPDLTKPYSHTEYTKYDCTSRNNSSKNPESSWMQKSGSQWSVLKRPTNESWFGPWEKYLHDNYGVKFHFGCKITRLHSNNDNIIGINVNDIVSNKPIRIPKYDYYVLAVTPFAVADIVAGSNTRVKQDRNLALFKGLTQDGPHIQVSFFIGFDKKVKVPKKDGGGHIAYILPDSPFNLTLYFQDDVWYDDVYLGPNIKSLISGTACVSYIPGKLYGKTLKETTLEEFKQEILYQLCECNSFCSIISNYNEGESFKNMRVSKFEVWNGWIFPKDRKSLLSQFPNEKKWVNSTNTNVYMPSIVSSFDNLFIVGAHVKSSVDLYSMETACATGRQAAFLIMNKCGYAKTIRSLAVEKPCWSRILSILDNLLYRLHLPNTLDTLSIMVVASVLLYIIGK